MSHSIMLQCSFYYHNLVQKCGEEFQFALVFILMAGRHDHTDSAPRMPAYLIKHSVIEHN